MPSLRSCVSGGGLFWVEDAAGGAGRGGATHKGVRDVLRWKKKKKKR